MQVPWEGLVRVVWHTYTQWQSPAVMQCDPHLVCLEADHQLHQSSEGREDAGYYCKHGSEKELPSGVKLAYPKLMISLRLVFTSLELTPLDTLAVAKDRHVGPANCYD